MSGNFSISRCSASQRADALRVLHDGLPVSQQLGLVQSLQSAREQDDSIFDGLFAAKNANGVMCSTWAQLTPGRTAVAWLPNAGSPAASSLMDALTAYLDEHEIALAQFLASEDDVVASELLTHGDFQKLAKLAYLAVDQNLFPGEPPKTEAAFIPNAGQFPERLGELLLRTYEQSLDCPQLNGIRNADDTLEGYRHQGAFSADRWFFVQNEGRDVGALILTEHTEGGNWELVYMGLVPEERGHGLGREILSFAMWQAGIGGAERLVLAVDEQNVPALDTYHRAGFVAWDHRTVYARLRPF